MTDAIRLDTLVELQDQYSDVYPLSPTGARGWVRARRELPKTEAEVFIEWDKSHWRYHGERDGWTFEHHFRPVVDEMPPQEELITTDKILDDAKARLDAERCPGCGGLHDDLQTRFIDTLATAQEALLDSDGFFIVTIQPQEIDGYLVYEPQIFSESLNDVAKAVVETQLIHLASQLFERLMVDRVNHIEAGDE